MEKLMLISGCSHTSGSEINGMEDSVYNRQKSYGNQLAYMMGYEPINVAAPAAANGTITRTVLEWFKENYDPTKMEVFVVVGWTESSRMEVPYHTMQWYEHYTPHGDWFSKTARNYKRINFGYEGFNDEEKEMMSYYQRFMADNTNYLEILSANYVLQLQYFFKSQKIDYVMCNTMHMFTPNEQLDFYLSLVDQTKYYNMLDNENAFFWKYRNAGYENPKAKYWHHNEVPHKLYAEELYKFIEENKCS